jgi:hypothetical protein
MWQDGSFNSSGTTYTPSANQTPCNPTGTQSSTWHQGAYPFNTAYAAFCNPNISGQGNTTCAQQGTCCGPNMTQDGTFGTTFEFTPDSTTSNDFVDLSTNYGSGPTTPPALCGNGGGNDCVSKAANIFFNLPIAWATNQSCSFTTKGTQVTGAECLTASCPDAYQTPTDDKQVACSISSQRYYVVTYCPAGSKVPNTPND